MALSFLRKATLSVVFSILLSIASLTYFDLDGLTASHSSIPHQLRPFRPLPIRLANAVGKVLQHFNLLRGLIPLDEKLLVQAACNQVDPLDCSLLSSRHGEGGGEEEEEWRVGLRVLLDSLENEASLTLFGRYFASQQIGDALKRRAEIQKYWKSESSWSKEMISRPIFIVGLPRTGTTFLQELLSQDTTLRTLKMWELMDPVPPPPSPSDVAGLSMPNVVDRIHSVQWNLDQYKRLAPGLDAWHPIHSERPEVRNISLFSPILFILLMTYDTYFNF